MWYVDAQTAQSIFERGVALTGEPGLGFYLGMQMTVTCHGLIGFAAMMASDVRGALEVAQEFIALQSSIHRVRLEEKDDFAYLHFEQTMAYPHDDIIQAALLLGFAQMGKAICGQELTGIAEVPFEQPAYFERFEHLIPGTLRFGQPRTCMVFKKDILDIPLLMSDPMSARLAREQCKRQLRELLRDSNLKSLVLDLLYDEALGFSSLPDVAAKMHLSERSLQRKLIDEGVNFRELVDELRCKKAVALLKNRNLTLEFISNHLGYAEVNNFSRAFKRWTGLSPRRYH